ncbi:MAG: SusC/RagA family TonB-linked outer membrane protein, partial [Bacteroidales bacterium]|nr:SusC/RagA family TonB-linked outer membrane protein [Bacteroidales bacterium]
MIKKARKYIRVYVIPRQLLMYLSMTLMLLTVNVTYGQSQHALSGVVVSASDNLPIPGVNVIIKGSTNGGITDLDGKYTIQVQEGDVVSISFMGFLTQEVTITNQTILDVALDDNVAMFEELVVVGYGVQQKKLVTGATVQIKSEDIGSRNSTNALQALQGQAPGVNITSSSGQPGEGLKVTIRGLGTIGDASPLYIVDGMQTSDIDYLNPADIASIDVLKDAASAAIYGSRAANGVVLVTTKRGKKGTSNITFDAYYGVQNAAKKMEMLNAKQYAQIMNEQHINSGNSQSTMPYDLNNLPIYSGSAAANTNWIDEMFVSNAITQNYVLGASGGSETMSYSSSIAYTGQEGIVGGSDFSNYERLSARFNSEKILYDGRLKFGENLSFAYITQNGIGVGNQYNNSLRGAFNASPLLPMYDNNGAYFNTNDKSILDQNGNTYTNDAESNPYASMVYNNQNINLHQKLIGSVYAELEIIRNLKYRSSVGFDLYNGQSRTYKPEYQLSRYDFEDTNVASQRMSKSLSYTLDNILTYDYNLGVSKFNFMAGHSVQVSSGEWMYASNSDIVFEGIDYAYLNNATNQEWARLAIQGAPDDDETLRSYFGRIQYNYNSTYMFNASFRADGSSKFAQGNQWGYFPAMSAGWVLSNEDFMSSVVDQVGFLKLRASWGQNGNQNIASFQYSAPISFSNVNYAFGDIEGNSTPGSYPSRLENVNIKWETSQQLNIGLDARILNDKLGINIDWYNKTTKDWLVKPPILATAGTNAPFVNGG